MIKEGKETYEEVGKRFKVGDIMKHKEKYLTAQERNYNPCAKVITENEFMTTVDSRIFEWFCQARARNLPITGEQVKAKALLVANSLNPDKAFKASNGWLDRFKKRYQISCKVLSGESRSMDASRTRRGAGSRRGLRGGPTAAIIKRDSKSLEPLQEIQGCKHQSPPTSNQSLA
jgi:hypothetical protein